MLESEFSKPNLRRILLNSFLWQCFLLSLPVLSSPTKHQPVIPLQTQNFKISKKIEIIIFYMCREFFLARMKAQWVEGGRTIQWVSHALVDQGSVRICLDFNWTPFHTVTELAIHTLSSNLCKMQLALDLQEYNYCGVDKSLVWPGRKQAQKHVRDMQFQQNRDASHHQVSFPARQGTEGNSRHSDRNISLFPSWSG